MYHSLRNIVILFIKYLQNIKKVPIIHLADKCLLKIFLKNLCKHKILSHIVLSFLNELKITEKKMQIIVFFNAVVNLCVALCYMQKPFKDQYLFHSVKGFYFLTHSSKVKLRLKH